MIMVADQPVAESTLAEIARRYKIRELSVFGSTQRGDWRDDSDVDVMVRFAPEANIGFEFFELADELSKVFGRPVDLTTDRILENPYRRAEILRTRRVLYVDE